MKLLTTIVQPDSVKNYTDIEDAQEQWEKVLKRYREVSSKLLPEDVLIVGFMNILPDKIKDAIYELKEDLDTLEEVQEYVLRQINSKKEVNVQGKIKSVQEDEPVVEGKEEAMEMMKTLMENEAVCVHMLSVMKGNGKGGFQAGRYSSRDILCGFCGKSGHMKRECRTLDREIKKYRAAIAKGENVPNPALQKGRGKSGFGSNLNFPNGLEKDAKGWMAESGGAQGTWERTNGLFHEPNFWWICKSAPWTIIESVA